MRRFIAMSALLMLAGCSSTPWQKEPIQANLMQRCPERLPALPGNTGLDITQTMKEWAVQYHDCRIRHNGLIEALKPEGQGR